MRLNLARSVVAVLFLAALAIPAQAASAGQNEQHSVVYELRLKNGSRLYGYVEADTPAKVIFRTLPGTTIEVDRGQVKSLEAASGRLVDGEFFPADPNRMRLTFAPTARTLRRGETHVGLIEFAVPFIQVGVTDRVAVGAGAPLIGGGFSVTSKVQVYERGALSAAAGILHLNLHLMDEGSSIGIAYAVTTYGHADSALTAGAGYAYRRDGTDHDATLVAIVGGEHRVHRRAKLIADGFLLRDAGMVSGSVRVLRGRMSTDIGVLTFFNGYGFSPPVPVINMLWKF